MVWACPLDPPELRDGQGQRGEGAVTTTTLFNSANIIQRFNVNTVAAATPFLRGRPYITC